MNELYCNKLVSSYEGTHPRATGLGARYSPISVSANSPTARR